MCGNSEQVPSIIFYVREENLVHKVENGTNLNM